MNKTFSLLSIILVLIGLAAVNYISDDKTPETKVSEKQNSKISGHQKLIVAVSAENKRYFPAIYQKIIRALNSTGINYSVIELPRKRSFRQLVSGEISMEMGIAEATLTEKHDLIKLQPPVVDLELALVTSINRPELCQLTPEQFKNYDIAIARGSHLLETIYSPMFNQTLAVDNYDTLARMIIAERADVTFIDRLSSDRLPKDLFEQVIFCETHNRSFRVNSYINKNYLWAKDKIEAAYRKEFAVR